MKVKGELSVEFMLEHDIDVFFKCQGYPVFLASRGRVLPKQLRNSDYLHEIKQKVLKLPCVAGNDFALDNNFLTQSIIADGYGYLSEGRISRLVEHCQYKGETSQITLFCRSFYKYAVRGLVCLDSYDDKCEQYGVMLPSAFAAIEGLVEIKPKAPVDFSDIRNMHSIVLWDEDGEDNGNGDIGIV